MTSLGRERARDFRRDLRRLHARLDETPADPPQTGCWLRSISADITVACRAVPRCTRAATGRRRQSRDRRRGGSMRPPVMVSERQREIAAFSKSPDRCSSVAGDIATRILRPSISSWMAPSWIFFSTTAASVCHRLQRDRRTPRFDLLRRARLRSATRQLHRNRDAARITGALVQARPADDTGRPSPRAGLVERVDVRISDAAARDAHVSAYAAR